MGSNHFVDSKKFGNISRFANHSCDPNMDLHFARINDELVPRIVLYSNRNIKAGEEVTYNYGTKFFVWNENGDFEDCNSVDSGLSNCTLDDYCDKRKRKQRKDKNSRRDEPEDDEMQDDMSFMTNELKPCFCGAKNCAKFLIQ